MIPFNLETGVSICSILCMDLPVLLFDNRLCKGQSNPSIILRRPRAPVETLKNMRQIPRAKPTSAIFYPKLYGRSPACVYARFKI